MHLPSVNAVLVMVPKTGSTTLYEGLGALGVTNRYWRESADGRHRGHYPESWLHMRLRQDKVYPEETWFTWRDPVDRWLSALNQAYFGLFADRHSSICTIDDAIDHALGVEPINELIFRPYRHWIDGTMPKRAFPFPPAALLRRLGHTGPIPHKQSGEGRWTWADIAHRLPEIEHHLADDLSFLEDL